MPDYSLCTGRHMWHDCKGTFLIKIIIFFMFLLTVHPNIMIVFFTNLMHKFFILIHLLHSSTCFEHYCADLQVDNCINTAFGIVTLFG